MSSRFCLPLIGVIACWTTSVIADEPAPTAAPPSAETLRAAVEKSIPLLEKGATGHREQRTCFACHNQGVPMLALTVARSRGFKIDAEERARQSRFIAEFLSRNRENYLKGQGTGGQADTAGYALWTLEHAEYASDETTSAVAEYLLLYQKDADHWTTSSNRPPSEASLFTTNFLALRGLQKFGTESQRERIAARTEQVRSWLLTAPVNDHEDRVFRLWGLKTVEAPADRLAADVAELASRQRADGGWSQLDGMESDAYATGSALVALHLAGGMAISDPVYARGLKRLLETQLADGSWKVASRSKPFQEYFESGFPHGKDQFISAAASAWATAAIALACEPKVE